MHELEKIKQMLHERNIDILNDGLEAPERKEVKNAYYNYSKTLRENKDGTFVKQAHDACLAAIAMFDKTQNKSNQLEQLLG